MRSRAPVSIKTVLLVGALVAQTGVILWVANPKVPAPVEGLPAGAATIRKADRPSQPPLDPSQFVSDLPMNRTVPASQLLRGFYSPEGDGPTDWRWTEKHFAVALASPEGAVEHGAMLRLEAAAVEAMLQKGPVTVTVKHEEQVLGTATLNTASTQAFELAVPPALVKTPNMEFGFEVDKIFSPANDSRVLGVIVSRITLMPSTSDLASEANTPAESAQPGQP